MTVDADFPTYRTRRVAGFVLLQEKGKNPLRLVGWRHRSGRFQPWVIRKFHERIRRRFPKGPVRILGVGLGAGMISHLEPDRFQVDYIEPNPEMIRLARERFGLPESTRVFESTIEDFCDDPPGCGPYDAIFYDVFLHHKTHWPGLSPERIRVLEALLSLEGVLWCNVIEPGCRLKARTSLEHGSLHRQPFTWGLRYCLPTNFLLEIPRRAIIPWGGWKGA